MLPVFVIEGKLRPFLECTPDLFAPGMKGWRL